MKYWFIKIILFWNVYWCVQQKTLEYFRTLLVYKYESLRKYFYISLLILRNSQRNKIRNDFCSLFWDIYSNCKIEFNSVDIFSAINSHTTKFKYYYELKIFPVSIQYVTYQAKSCLVCYLSVLQGFICDLYVVSCCMRDGYQSVKRQNIVFYIFKTVCKIVDPWYINKFFIIKVLLNLLLIFFKFWLFNVYANIYR